MNIARQFNEPLIEKLFPFYLIINNQNEVIAVGKSFLKVTGIQLGMVFQDVFEIKRPHIEIDSFNALCNLQNQMIFFQCKTDNGTLFRGQFELISNEREILFVGSPWFYSMDNVIERNLTLSDFAIHDPMMDLLHVLKTAEMASEDLKQLVKTIDKQKKDLKSAAIEINNIALFPKQNPDPLIRINLQGELITLNPAAEKIDFLLYDGKKYKLEDVWKEIIKHIDPLAPKSFIEAYHNDILFSFLMVLLDEQGYYNIYGRDITLQKKIDNQVKMLSVVADKTTNLVLITNANGIIEWVNAAFEEFTGYTFEEVKGLKPGSFLQGEETNQETVSYLHEKIKEGNNFQCEILNYTKNGEKYWVKLNLQFIKDTNGKVVQIFSIQDNITAEKNQQYLLEQREEKYRSIISNIDLGLVEVDLSGNIQLLNQSFCKMSAYTESELIGKNIQTFFVDDVENPWMKAISLKHKTNKVNVGEIVLKNKFGKKRNWRISVAPIFNDVNAHVGFTGIHLDITDRKEQEEKLEGLLATIQGINQELNDFAYIVSHDLKAPLRAIGSLATWLEADYADKFDDEGKQTLSLLVQRTQRMHNLIEGVLNYSRVGRKKENVSLVNTHELVLKIVDLISPPTNITVRLENELHNVYFEEVKLQQVFQNLLSNAVKFIDKPQGEIVVSSKEENDEIVFMIKDNGPGIEKGHFERIFQIFQTLHARDDFESTGIGLSIVKKIIENFGGRIWLESTVKVGTTFYFSIKNNLHEN